MSTTEDIFLRTNLGVPEAAQAIAEALGFEIQRDETGIYLGRYHVGDLEDYVTGELSINYLAEDEPTIPDAIDEYSLMWSLHKKGIPDWILQMRGARAVFHEIVEKLHWPALLTHDSHTAIADWNPEHGLREFPSDTPTDSELVLAHNT